MEFKIRKGRKEDAGQVCPLWWDMQTDHESRDPVFYKLLPRPTVIRMFKKYWIFLVSDRNAQCVVAEMDGKIIGAAIGKIEPLPPVNANRKRAGLEVIFVEKKYRGKGVGKALIAPIEKWAGKKGFPIIGLTVDARNARARKFYRKAGFKDRNILMIKAI